MGREAAESLHHRPDAAATAAAAAAILLERSGCARLFPPRRRSRRETPRALIPPPSLLPPPSASLRTRLTPCRSRWLPSLSSSVQPPRPQPTPCARSPTAPSPDLCQRPEGKRAARGRGGSRVSERWRRLRAGRGYVTSPAPADFAPRGGSTRAGTGGPPCPRSQRVVSTSSAPLRGSGEVCPSFGYFEGGDGCGSAAPGTPLAPHLAS